MLSSPVDRGALLRPGWVRTTVLTAVGAALLLVAPAVLAGDDYGDISSASVWLAEATVLAVLIRLGMSFRENNRLMAVLHSDSVTDAPMLEVVGHPHAVNPDKELRRLATGKGWPILVFARPVALRSRMRLPAGKPTLAALAVGGVVVVGGAILINIRKRGQAV